MPTDLTTSSSDVSMTSKEIADLVDSRHDSTKRAIKRLANQGVISHPPLVDGIKTANGVIEQVYVFSGKKGKRDSTIVVAQLSPAFTACLVDRWEELEEQLKAPQQPQHHLSDGEAVAEMVKVLKGQLGPEAAFTAATKLIAKERGIEHRLLIQSDEVMGRSPGMGDLPPKGISEEDLAALSERCRKEYLVWSAWDLADKFNLYDRKGRADTRLVLRMLEASDYLHIVNMNMQIVRLTTSGKHACPVRPYETSNGTQSGAATKWEVNTFISCYLDFLDKHSYEFTNFRTY